jgi:hypothetical protein
MAIEALQASHKAMDLVVIGLGTGAIASYCRPGDIVAFIEIDAAISAIARDYFPYVSEASTRCRVEVIAGDGRLVLRAMRDRRPNVVVVDAFTSDAIPVHLLTAEAFQEYIAAVGDGLIALHVSSRNAVLGPIVASTAEAAQLNWLWVDDSVRDGGMRSPASWIFLTTSMPIYQALRRASDSTQAGFSIQEEFVPMRPWTDARHNSLRLFIGNPGRAK